MISDLAVIVPAADVEDHIANRLEGINAARRHLKGSVAGRRIHVEVIVFSTTVTTPPPESSPVTRACSPLPVERERSAQPDA